MSVPHGHWKTTTFIGGLRLSGVTAPMMLDGPMTGEWFAAYARKVLAPTLSPGDVVILDNLPAHKSAEAREAVEAVGAHLLFLPPYSPDFNPIENIFAKIKAPRAAVRQCSIADMTLSCCRGRRPIWAARQAGPAARKMSPSASEADMTAPAPGSAVGPCLRRRQHAQPVERTDNGPHGPCRNLCIKGRGLQAGMTQQDLDHADIDTRRPAP